MVVIIPSLHLRQLDQHLGHGLSPQAAEADHEQVHLSYHVLQCQPLLHLQCLHPCFHHETMRPKEEKTQ